MGNVVTRYVAARIDRAVKDRTPEHLARRSGESIPVRMLPKDLQALGAEIDSVFGNNLGGDDLREVDTFRRETQAKIADAQKMMASCRPGSSAQSDLNALIAGWQRQLVDADRIEAIIRQADSSLLRDVAGMVLNESTGVLGTIAERIAEAAKMQVNVTAGLGAGNGRTK